MLAHDGNGCQVCVRQGDLCTGSAKIFSRLPGRARIGTYGAAAHMLIVFRLFLLTYIQPLVLNTLVGVRYRKCGLSRRAGVCGSEETYARRFALVFMDDFCGRLLVFSNRVSFPC